MDQSVHVRAVLFVLVGPALVLALLLGIFGWSIQDGEEFLLSLMSAYFVSFVPALILAQCDQMLADRNVRLRPLLVAMLPCVVGYTLIGLLALQAPQALSQLLWVPVAFAMPFGFCSWATGRFG